MLIRPNQLSNSIIAERIISGILTVRSLREVQYRKELNQLLGKHSEVSVEKFIIKCYNYNSVLFREVIMYDKFIFLH